MIQWSKEPVRIDVVLGTRPEAVKLLPVVWALRADDRFETRVVATAQHREMLDQVLEPFGVEPDVDLNVMHAGQTLSQLIGRVVPLVDRVLRDGRPDMVVVQGDTASAFCAALAAFHRGIGIGHVEAGLRSFDRLHPFPEECYRRMIDTVAELHFAPTPGSATNLEREGVSGDSIVVTGNTAIDALTRALELVEQGAGSEAPGHPREEAPLVLATLHRRESYLRGGVGRAPLEGTLRALADAARAHPEIDLVYPVHRNPDVQALAHAELDGLSNVRLIDPQPYLPFVRLMSRAHVIVTDSGGIQEEAPTLGVPVLVARDVTERPEGLRPGVNRLIGTSRSEVREALEEALARDRAPIEGRPYPNPFGDGRAADRIRDAIAHAFQRGPRPVEFHEPPRRAMVHPRGRTRIRRNRPA